MDRKTDQRQRRVRHFKLRHGSIFRAQAERQGLRGRPPPNGEFIGNNFQIGSVEIAGQDAIGQIGTLEPLGFANSAGARIDYKKIERRIR